MGRVSTDGNPAGRTQLSLKDAEPSTRRHSDCMTSHRNTLGPLHSASWFEHHAKTRAHVPPPSVVTRRTATTLTPGRLRWAHLPHVRTCTDHTSRGQRTSSKGQKNTCTSDPSRSRRQEREGRGAWEYHRDPGAWEPMSPQAMNNKPRSRSPGRLRNYPSRGVIENTSYTHSIRHAHAQDPLITMCVDYQNN